MLRPCFHMSWRYTPRTAWILPFGLKSLHFIVSPTPSSHRICMVQMHKCICVCMLGVFKMSRLKWVNTTASLNRPMDQSSRLCLSGIMDFRATLEGTNLHNVALRASNPTVAIEVQLQHCDVKCCQYTPDKCCNSGKKPCYVDFVLSVF